MKFLNTLAILGLEKIFNLERVEVWFQTGGYFMLFGLLFACGIGLPLPEDIPLLLGGYFVALGKMHIVAVAVLAWCGIIGGDCMLYGLSRKYGMNITKIRMIGTHVTEERILWAEQKFEKYGVWVVAVCRMVAGVRGAMVIAAGVLRYNFLKFIIADGLAALFSGGFFIWLGWIAGRKLGSIDEMREKIKDYEALVAAGILAGICLFIAYILWRRKKRTTLSEIAVDKVEHVAHRVKQSRGAASSDASSSDAPSAD
jgi:membrane protein DedA with SNARE-associated domain